VAAAGHGRRGEYASPRSPLAWVDEIVTQLRDAILAHRIPPGTKLVQTEPASQLGVSRELLELYQIREVIDGLAASLLAAKGLDSATDTKPDWAIDR
jgi:DNA-binding GntR family transcriptional regulator